MSRSASTLAHAASLVVLAGCFSGDPIGLPTFATDATAVLIAPVNGGCNGNWKFIGDVAIAAGGDGYTLEGPWEGPGCDMNMGGLAQVESDVLAFGTGTPATGSTAGSGGQTSGTTHGHVAADGATGLLAWAYRNNMGGQGGQGPGGADILVAAAQGAGPSPVQLGVTGLGLGSQATGNLDVMGLVIVDSAAYLAVSGMTMTAPDVNNPTFPCCDQSTLGAIAPGFLYRVGLAATPAPSQITAMSFPAGMPNVLASNSDTVFYMVRPAGAAVAEIGAFPKTGSGDSDRVALGQLTTDLAPEIAPVGLAADDQHVAWAAAIDLGIAPSKRGCWIFSLPLPAQSGATPQLLFTSTEFSCMSLAIDATSVYFAIVDIDQSSEALHGLGIGRVSLADGSFESIAVHMVGDYAGPRRVYLDNSTDSIYAIDPLVVGKLAKTALDGQHAF